MNKKFTIFLLSIFLPVLLGSAKGANVDTNLLRTLKQLNHSKFENNPKVGKDPFFPESDRRDPQPKEVPTIVNTSATPHPKRVEVVNLVLKGIVNGKAGTRLALINNQTFTAGESKYIRTSGGTAKVTCIAILERSVSVEVDGMAGKRELKLKEGL